MRENIVIMIRAYHSVRIGGAWRGVSVRGKGLPGKRKYRQG